MVFRIVVPYNHIQMHVHTHGAMVVCAARKEWKKSLCIGKRVCVRKNEQKCGRQGVL